ncbi:MAG: hypothetical protein MUC53_13680 [Candidatus Contendobacter sp.]|nr:hypothetical protein [Candidatus Contendobacter sp.]
MKDPQQDAGVLAVLIERLESQRLPRALALKEKVDQGGRLDDFDIAFLEEVFSDSQEVQPLMERHPEHQGIAAKMMALYHDITEKALANEQAGGKA